MHETVGIPAAVKLAELLVLQKLLGFEVVPRMIEHLAQLPRRALQEGAQRVHKSVGRVQVAVSSLVWTPSRPNSI